MEEDIKILKKAIKVLTGKDTGIKLNFEATAQAIEETLNRLKEQEKLIKIINKQLVLYKTASANKDTIIEEMAKYISTKNYADDICEFRLDVKGRFHKHCYKGECKDCISEYFRKKCE